MWRQLGPSGVEPFLNWPAYGLNLARLALTGHRDEVLSRYLLLGKLSGWRLREDREWVALERFEYVFHVRRHAATLTKADRRRSPDNRAIE